eukprot:jgi/Psemu1/293454/fgenesh1_pg.2408_\
MAFGGKRRAGSTVLLYADSPVNLSEMKASEMKKELESYGISTRSMFDRKDFEKALEKARLDRPEKSRKTASDGEEEEKSSSSSSFPNGEEAGAGKSKKDAKSRREKWSKKWKSAGSASDPNNDESSSNPRAAKSSGDATPSSTEAPKKQNEKAAADASSTDDSSSSSSSSSSPETKPASSREERYEAALEEGRAMKLSSLKKELKDRGISTTSFFEKADLVKAYANAIADDVEVKGSSSSDESYDPSYRDVTTSIFDPSALLAGREMIIDITESIKK